MSTKYLQEIDDAISPAPVLNDEELDQEPAEVTWRAEANCHGVDPDVFYPEQGGDVRPAREICKKCPVTADCLEDALLHRERFGIWGGKTEKERRRIRRRRAILRSQGRSD